MDNVKNFFSGLVQNISGTQQQQSQQPQPTPGYTQQLDPIDFPSSYGSSSYGGHSHSHGGVSVNKIPGPQPDGKLSAIIVTICEGSTYDGLFAQVPQRGPAGSRVDVYQASAGALPHILKLLKNPKESLSEVNSSSVITELVTGINALDKTSIVFNWECCSGFSSTFGTCKNDVMEAMQEFINRGFLLMFSDFALKSLVADWNEERLGPNPFIHFSDFSDSFELKFLPSVLKECPSAQLQKVGSLCENGTANVHAMSSTIAYTVNKTKSDTSKYDLKVLTVATRLGSDTKFAGAGNNLVSIEKKGFLIGSEKFTGVAGHVLLTYPTGGKILVSCGHWLELARLDVSEEALLKVAARDYGAVESDKICAELSSAKSAYEREEVVQKYSRQYVQETSPAGYSSF